MLASRWGVARASRDRRLYDHEAAAANVVRAENADDDLFLLVGGLVLHKLDG